MFRSKNTLFFAISTLYCGIALLSTPAAALTSADVSIGFNDGVSYCVAAGLKRSSISQLLASDHLGVSPSGDAARHFLGDPPGPVWDVASARGIVVISEPSPGVCQVHAYGPPVDATFQATLASIKRKHGDLIEKPEAPGYDPIVYRLIDRTSPESNLSVLLHGAEPGTPGHLFRFSRLEADITWSIAADATR